MAQLERGRCSHWIICSQGRLFLYFCIESWRILFSSRQWSVVTCRENSTRSDIVHGVEDDCLTDHCHTMYGMTSRWCWCSYCSSVHRKANHSRRFPSTPIDISLRLADEFRSERFRCTSMDQLLKKSKGAKETLTSRLSNSDLYRYWSNTWDYLPSDVDKLVKRYNRRECFVSVLCLYTWCELKRKTDQSLPFFGRRSPYFVCRCIWQRNKLEDRFSLRIASNPDWRLRPNNSDCLHTSIHRRRFDNEQDIRNVHLVDTFASDGRLCVWRYQWGELVRLGMTIDDGLLRWHRGTYHRFYRKLTIKRTMVTSRSFDLFFQSTWSSS